LAHETGGTAKISYLPGGVVFEAVAPLVDSADNDNDNDNEQRNRAEERN
jgi:hypothetical protein